ncbi:hypothetical protein, partial [Streptomyces flaveolus]|uniref:hypothetical protein n=1 Tax=Streptomyces flaveolus TaxID=67297 RepID=UPI003415BB58
HGVQLWVALPDEHRHTARDFRHHVPGRGLCPGTARCGWSSPGAPGSCSGRTLAAEVEAVKP